MPAVQSASLPRNLEFRELRNTVTAAIAAGREPDLTRVLNAINRHIFGIEAERDCAGAIRAAASVDRLYHLLDRDHARLTPFALGYLTSTLVNLDRLVARLSQYESIMAANREAEGVRGRVATMIDAEPGIRPTQIADRLELTPPAITRALRELEAAGRIRVEPHPDDRRGRICVPTG